MRDGSQHEQIFRCSAASAIDHEAKRNDLRLQPITRTSIVRRNASPAHSLLALAVGAVAAGALAFGAVAIGQMVIGRLAIGKARFKSLEVDELTVRKLRVIERVDAES